MIHCIIVATTDLIVCQLFSSVASLPGDKQKPAAQQDKALPK